MPAVTVPRPHADADLAAHLVTPPAGSGPWPAVVVVHEAFGLTDDMREIAGRFAAAGYLALAPNLFTDGGAMRCLRGTFRALGRGEGKAFADLDAARAWLADRDDCTGRVGIAGFCLGGGFALLSATRGFDAAAPNYGDVPDDLDEVLQGACPVVASFGARDRALRGGAVKLETALQRAGVPHDVKEYPDAGHSFLNRHRFGPIGTALFRAGGVGFHGPSAEDAWGRILRMFDAELRRRP
ncbi:MAG: carboxymethylenebutenolidase [Conexibacter sp.]|nr:carboxymethylenebutenolidase [Conexibacter sp.]